ncbi:MAG: DUF2867 domain-containing protein [Plesiomonas sp.]|uniref:DUF2867 domain-containing protein n=1 Tax=Plesiomonas sp. TaxID=2486279 RepID=UPI003F2CF62D
MSLPRILILGANGYIGTSLIAHLIPQGYNIRAVARDTATLSNQTWATSPQVELVYADLQKAETLNGLLTDIDIVYYLVHSMNDGNHFLAQEQSAATHCAQILQQSSVKKVIYLGALQPHAKQSEHLQARRITGELLRGSGIPVIELRSGIIVGAGSAAFEVMRDLVNHLPIMITPRWVRSKTSPIALDNLLFYLSALINTPINDGIFDVGGPDYISYQDQMKIYADITGKSCIIIPVPFLSPALSAKWLRVITTVPINIARALIGGLSHDLPANSAPLQALIPQPLLSYREAISETLKHGSDFLDSARWGYDADAKSTWKADYSFYPKNAGYRLATRVSSKDLWEEINKVGGDHGYFYADILWTTRAHLDRLFGGKPHVRQRPEHAMLQVGDKVDSWKVICADPEKKLSLLFGMKAPGLGRLDFTITEKDNLRYLDVRAWWHPAGFPGLLYWFAMMPAHLFIFRGMCMQIVKNVLKNQKC